MFWCNLFLLCWPGSCWQARMNEQQLAFAAVLLLPVDTAAADFYSNVGAVAFLFVSLRGQRLTGSGKGQQKG